MEQILNKVANGTIKNIIVMTGAGISTSAGIPDFRSPNTGLYSSQPEEVFSIELFRSKPQLFCTLAKRLLQLQTQAKPTRAHWFLKALEEHKVLRRVYTQNIDGLEFACGLPSELIVQAHGGMQTASCSVCLKSYDIDQWRRKILAGKIPSCAKCQGPVKPDIVFYGEALPRRFSETLQADFESCDLLIVMGTSLQVYPFAALLAGVKPTVSKILINLQTTSNAHFSFEARDYFLQTTCDAGVEALMKILTWTFPQAK